jgi:hypothetical protein
VIQSVLQSVQIGRGRVPGVYRNCQRGREDLSFSEYSLRFKILAWANCKEWVALLSVAMYVRQVMACI